jgi:hypothetical protein
VRKHQLSWAFSTLVKPEHVTPFNGVSRAKALRGFAAGFISTNLKLVAGLNVGIRKLFTVSNGRQFLTRRPTLSQCWSLYKLWQEHPALVDTIWGLKPQSVRRLRNNFWVGAVIELESFPSYWRKRLEPSDENTVATFGSEYSSEEGSSSDEYSF